MGNGKKAKAITARSEILDLRTQIREMLTSPREGQDNQEVTVYVIPGRWTVAEFGQLLAAAA